MNNIENISGGISGAISDPLSPEAQEHAELFYEEIRHRFDDVEKIAKFMYIQCYGITNRFPLKRLQNGGNGEIAITHEVKPAMGICCG